jgi:hypothetical protein
VEPEFPKLQLAAALVVQRAEIVVAVDLVDLVAVRLVTEVLAAGLALLVKVLLAAEERVDRVVAVAVLMKQEILTDIVMVEMVKLG